MSGHEPTFWEKTKANAAWAADATKRAAQRLALKNDNRIRRGKIRELKKAVGPPAYAAFECNDIQEVRRLFERTKKQIDQLHQQIHDTEDKIIALMDPPHHSSDTASSSSSSTPSHSQTPSSSAVSSSNHTPSSSSSFSPTSSHIQTSSSSHTSSSSASPHTSLASSNSTVRSAPSRSVHNAPAPTHASSSASSYPAGASTRTSPSFYPPHKTPAQQSAASGATAPHTQFKQSTPSRPTVPAPGPTAAPKPKPAVRTSPPVASSAAGRPSSSHPAGGATSGPNCSKCRKPCQGGISIPGKEGLWHEPCFVCTGCSCKFTAGGVMLVQGQPYCQKCGSQQSRPAASSASPGRASGLGSPARPSGGGSITSPGKTLTGTQGLLQWCQVNTEGFNLVSLKNWTKSWHSGLGFAALVANWRPDAMDWKRIDPRNALGTLKSAFESCEKAGVSTLIDAEDVCEADKKSIITQITMYQRAFGNAAPNPQGKAVWNQHAGLPLGSGDLLDYTGDRFSCSLCSSHSSVRVVAEVLLGEVVCSQLAG
eukprot:g3148.t1